MKKLLAILLIASLACVTLAACDGPGPGPSGGDDTTDWDSLTSEELYQMALEEGGTIGVYCDTSKMPKVCASFEEKYPGLKAVSYELADEEILTKISIEVDGGINTGDIMVSKDVNGDIWYTYQPQGYIMTYFPKDIVSHIPDKELLDYGLPFYSSMTFWYYNADMYPDGSPINNWWDIVELNDDGTSKFLLLAEGFTEVTYLSFMCMMISRADEMAEAYQLKYGEPITYTYDVTPFAKEGIEIPENNAGYEFMYRLAQMKRTYIDDGDDIVKGVLDSKVPTIGLTSGGKIANRTEEGWNIDWCLNLEPFTNFQNTIYSYVIKNTSRPAGARLFIRYMMGEADGKSEGFDPFVKEGNWPVRDDVINEENRYTLAELDADALNMAAVHEIYLDTEDFWVYWESHFKTHTVVPSKDD